MNTRKSIFFKVFSTVVTALFLFNTVLYGMDVPVDNLSPEPRVLRPAENPVPELGTVAEDMAFMSVAGYIAKVLLEEGRDNLRTRLIAAFTSDDQIPFGADSTFETFIAGQKIDLKNTSVEGDVVSIPFEKNGVLGMIRIAPRESDSVDSGWAVMGDIAYVIEAREEIPVENHDLKGLGIEDIHTDPFLKQLFEEKKIVEISLDAENNALTANRIVPVKDYIAGITTPDMFLGPEVDIKQLFTEEEVTNIKEWLKAHPVRGSPAKFRIILSSGAINWDRDVDHSNISHTGVNDGVIYIGGTFLSVLMRAGNEEIRRNVLDEDEYQHLQGLQHGEEEEYKIRLDSVRETLDNIEAIETEVKNEDVVALHKRLAGYLDSDNEADLFSFLSMYNQFSLSMSHAPVESRYPIKKAVVMLDKEQQDKLYNILTKRTKLAKAHKDLIIVDELKLLHTDLAEAKDWIKRFAPELEGRSLWHISPEIWHEAGGLSRVMQYHGVGMKDLIGDSNVRFRQLEPQYINRIDADGNPQPLDYAKDITHKVDNLEEVDRFKVTVGGKEIEAIVSRGVNDLGIETFMIRDAGGFYTHSLYNYREPWQSLEERNLPSWEEFTVFYSKASLEFVKRFEQKEREILEDRGQEWKSPLLHTNDSQTALVSVYARIQRDEELRKQAEDPDYTIDPILEDMILAFTTHTYRNRKDYTIEDSGYADRVLDFMDIPWEYRELFMHLGGDGRHVYDIASAGLRTADWQGAVARAHRDDVAPYDEWVNTTEDPALRNALNLFGTEVNVVGVSNGDNRAASSKVFRKIGEELFNEDFEPNSPTPEQIMAINREAKKRLRLREGQVYYTTNDEPDGAFLNPDQMVFSYTGRLVPEKFELDKEVIRNMVRKGVQVVVYGNVQTNNPQSDKVRDMLLGLIDELRRERDGWGDKSGFGKLLFVPRFIQADQRNLLPATNVGFFMSTPGTEAAGYTEADFSSCGGCVWAPARFDNGIGEGLLSAQGLPLNLSVPGEGNTIMAASGSADDQWRAVEPIINLGLEGLAPYQATSVRFSRILEAKFTSAQYLREFSMAIKDIKRRREKRDAYIKMEKRKEMEKTLLRQLMPDPENNPKEFVEREITQRVLDGRKDATELFFTSPALAATSDKLDAAVKVANNLIAIYNEDGSYDLKVRAFLRQLVSDSIYWTGEDSESVDLSRSMQVISGQALMILSWIDSHVKGARAMRLTADENEMAESPRSKSSPSFIAKNSLPVGAEEVQEEGAPGFFWRGIEKITKLGKNIITAILGKGSEVLSSQKEKAVLYLMDHGFSKVPDTLKNMRTKDPQDKRNTPKRLTPLHDTLFLNDLVPGSTQYASTGAGHFQGKNLDVKYITEGKGLQVNVLYDAAGNIEKVIAHEVSEGQWTLALPGYVDYMINLGGLRFNDISVALTAEEAQKFNPKWDFLGGKAPSPEVQPLMAYREEGKAVYVKNMSDTADLKLLPKESYDKGVAGELVTLLDLYAMLGEESKGKTSREKVEGLVKRFADGYQAAFMAATAPETEDINSIDENKINNENDPQSFGHIDGLNTFIDDNAGFLSDLLPLSTDSPVLIRIPVEILQVEGSESFEIFIKALSELENVYVELFSYSETEIAVDEMGYNRYGLSSPEFPEGFQKTRENTLTIMVVDTGEQFPDSENNRAWDRLGKNFDNGSKYGFNNTIMSPVGFNYDGAGLMRSVFLGLRLTEIAKNGYTEHDPFVNYTLLQYRELCISQGKSVKEFNLKGQDLVNLASSQDIAQFVGSLNRIIRLLPIMPINVEELRLIYERAREALIRA